MMAEPAHRVRSIRAASLGLALLAAVPAQAGDARDRHAVWQGCLDRTFAVQVRLTSRMLAADTALTTCRPSEDAYLAALAGSPLLDGTEAARARPALVSRARDRLLERRTAI